MADRTAIEWTRGADGSAGATWTPIRARWFAPTNDGSGVERIGWHCEHASEGCRNCYSEAFNHKRLGTGLPFKPGHRADVEVFLDEKMLLAPLKWTRPRRIFVCSMTDLFADFVPDAMIDRVFAIMALAPWHTFQCLTKRPARMRAYIEARSAKDELGYSAEAIRIQMTALAATPSRREMVPALKQISLGKFCQQVAWPLPNVWLGTSTEDQATADARVPELLATPAALRFVSAEPLLGPIDFTNLDPNGNFRPYGAHGWSAIWKNNHIGRAWLDWIITGGESGPRARPTHPAWVRSIRDQCAAAGVAFFHKQWGEWAPALDVEGLVRSEGHGTLGAILENGAWTIFPRGDRHGDVFKLGKKAAGRRLDGEEWSQTPEARA